MPAIVKVFGATNPLIGIAISGPAPVPEGTNPLAPCATCPLALCCEHSAEHEIPLICFVS